MRAYIPKQIKPVRERVEAKLDREVILELEQYCRYLDSDRDYVIAQALIRAFRKDKAFTNWKTTQPAAVSRKEETERPLRSMK